MKFSVKSSFSMVFKMESLNDSSLVGSSLRELMGVDPKIEEIGIGVPQSSIKYRYAELQMLTGKNWACRKDF